MKLPIESWLENANPPAEAMVSFAESVLAFKIGAYRAALMFSYVGFGLCLRRRLMVASCPTGLLPAQWVSIQASIRDDHGWDAAVFDCTQMRAPKNVFDVDDHLREEMKYWKNRRNDCAHFKRNEIGAAHVEAFWLYLRSNLGRWVPNGSRSDILQRLQRNFDANLTPPGTSVLPIVAMVPSAVPQAELQAFFEDIVVLLTSTLGTLQFVHTEQVAEIFCAALDLHDAVVSPAARDWLCGKLDILVSVIRRTPKHVSALHGQLTVIRNLWRQHLFSGGHNDLPVLGALLRNSLIPGGEVPEAIERVVSLLNGEIPSAADNEALTSAGFWQAFRQRTIEARGINQFAWGNRNAALIAWWVQNVALDTVIVTTLCDVFGAPPFPFDVRDALKQMLAANPARMAEILAIALAAGKIVPVELQ